MFLMPKKRTTIIADEALFEAFTRWREKELLSQGDAIESLMAYAISLDAEQLQAMRKALNCFREKSGNKYRSALSQAQSERKSSQSG